jgi:hypothetical protein
MNQVLLFACIFSQLKKNFFFGLMKPEFELRALLLESSVLRYFLSILCWSFWKWGLVNYLSGLALNLNPPSLQPPK